MIGYDTTGETRESKQRSHTLQIFNKKEAALCNIALPMKITCFRTSIWDETLYLVRLRTRISEIPKPLE